MTVRELFRRPPREGEAVPPGAVAFVLLAGPAVVSITFLVNVFMARAGCGTVTTAARFALVVAAIAVTAAAALLGWRMRRLAREGIAPGPGGAEGRNRFLLAGGLAMSLISGALGLFFLAVLLFLDPCFRP